MNIKELKENLQNIENTASFMDEIPTRNYLPIFTKKYLVNSVCSDVVEFDENGLAYVDEIQKKISISIVTLIHYCDIEMTQDTDEDNADDIVETLDLLYETGVYNCIEEYIGEDLNELKLAVETEIENIKLRNNSLESIVAKGLSKIVNTLPNDKQIKSIIKTASKEFQKFEPSKMKEIQEMMKVVK